MCYYRQKRGILTMTIQMHIPPGYISPDQPNSVTLEELITVAMISSDKQKHQRIHLKLQITTFEYLCFSITGLVATVVVLLI